MAKRVLCKFFAHGACLKGERCDYSHDWKAPPNNICIFYQRGVCAYGSRCRYEHVKLSSGSETRDADSNTAFRPQEREAHVTPCERGEKHVEMLKRSQEIECGVCFESILSKPTPAERKFGILSECDHPFCLSCIRSWRGSGEDVCSATRSCPLCRKLAYFVIPSVTWYSSKAEKQEIIKSYKAKLRSIDCKHFNFGNAKCPFGSSCFYRHTVKPGLFLSNATPVDEVDLSSNPRNPVENEELDNDNYEDLDNIIAELMELFPPQQDEDEDDDDNLAVVMVASRNWISAISGLKMELHLLLKLFPFLTFVCCILFISFSFFRVFIANDDAFRLSDY